MSNLEARILGLEARWLPLQDLMARLAAAEQAQWQSWANENGGTGDGSSSGWVGRVTTAIAAAASATQPGTGVVTLQDFDGTNFTDATAGVTVYNTTEKTIAIGAIVQGKICVGSNGVSYRFVDTPDKCANLS